MNERMSEQMRGQITPFWKFVFTSFSFCRGNPEEEIKVEVLLYRWNSHSRGPLVSMLAGKSKMWFWGPSEVSIDVWGKSGKAIKREEDVSNQKSSHEYQKQVFRWKLRLLMIMHRAYQLATDWADTDNRSWFSPLASRGFTLNFHQMNGKTNTDTAAYMNCASLWLLTSVEPQIDRTERKTYL